MEHKTHWKKMTNTNYFGSWDLEAGKDMIVLIKEVRKETIQNAQGREEGGRVSRRRAEASDPEHDQPEGDREGTRLAIHRGLGRPQDPAVHREGRGVRGNHRSRPRP